MKREAVGLFGLRLVIAAVFLWHGVPKAIDPAAAAVKFVGFGLPGFLGPVIGVVEVVAAGMLILGFAGRRPAAVLLVIITGALLTVQIPGGITASLERDALVFVGLLVLLFMPDESLKRAEDPPRSA